MNDATLIKIVAPLIAKLIKNFKADVINGKISINITKGYVSIERKTDNPFYYKIKLSDLERHILKLFDS